MEDCVSPIQSVLIRELANLAITLAGKENQVLAFSAYYDHPVVEGVDPAQWEQRFRCNYDLPQANVSSVV